MKKGQGAAALCPSFLFVLGNPGFYLVLCQSLDILGGIGRLGTAVYVDEIISLFGNEESFLVSVRISEVSVGKLLNESCGFGIVLYLANRLFHVIAPFLFFTESIIPYFTQNFKKNLLDFAISFGEDKFELREGIKFSGYPLTNRYVFSTMSLNRDDEQ